MLSRTTLAALLPTKKLDESLFVFDELPSTNALALELAKKHAPSATVILADRQTAGRGRWARSWFSPPSVNIYGSLIFYFKNPFQAAGWIPLMAGVAIAEAIEDTTGIAIALKWPNDVLIAEQKLGGILCESFSRGSTETCMVIGFGINVNLSQSALPEELRSFATSLLIKCQHHVDRENLLKQIILSLEQGYASLLTQGPQGWHSRYSSRCATIGRKIRVQFPDGSQLHGLAQSIGTHGQLQVAPSPSDFQGKSARIVDIYSGEILHIRTQSLE